MCEEVQKGRKAHFEDYKRTYNYENRSKNSADTALRRFGSAISHYYKEDMRVFYDKAVYLCDSTGIRHEVDHIIPLNNDKVSGLHVPWNLRVLTAKENRDKGDKLV